MKVQTTIAGTALRARLTALCWGALTLLAPVAVSACSGSSSTPTVPTFTPSVTASGTATGSVTAPASSGSTPSSGTTVSSSTSASGTPGVTSSPTVTATVTRTATAPATESSTSQIPTVAPAAGGGGTAGLQDALLFGLGGAAILAGAGSIAYRRRITRRR
jgi:hypothetical protein